MPTLLTVAAFVTELLLLLLLLLLFTAVEFSLGGSNPYTYLLNYLPTYSMEQSPS